jgi:transposase
MHADCHPSGGRQVKVPKLGLVRSRERLTKLNRLLERDPHARIVRATLTRAREGRWAVSFTVERSPKRRRARQHDAAVGVDLGLRKLAVLSTGQEVENPRGGQRYVNTRPIGRGRTCPPWPRAGETARHGPCRGES